MAALECKFTLSFSSFCFSYISWVNDSSAILLVQNLIMLNFTYLPLAANLLEPNFNTSENNKSIFSDLEDELSLPPSNSRLSPVLAPSPSFEENATL